MRITLCDINMIHPNGIKIEKPYGFGNYLFLRLKTPARFCLDGVWYQGGPDDIILYREGAPQYYESPEGAVYCDDFLFFETETEEDRRFMEGLSLIDNRLLHLPHIQECMNVHEMLCMEFINQDEHSKEIIDHLLKIFLMKLDRCMNTDAVIGNHHLYEALNLLRLDMYKTPARPWTVETMAQSVNLSPSYFQSVYKKTFHISCMADLFASRMHLAKNLLVTTSLPVQEIARTCGYDSATYFSRHFKKKTGITPSTYRNNCQ